MHSVFWIATAIIVFMAIAILFFALFNQNRFMKLRRKEDQLLLQTALASEKAERQRIAADLHDGLSGDLSGIRNYLTILLTEEQDSDKTLIYENIKKLVDEAFENTRLVAYKLMPPLLETKGFAAALKNYIATLEKKSKTQFILASVVEDFTLTANAQYELFRILQELMTNIIKHGNAASCRIELGTAGHQMVIAIIDNGNSYSFEECKKDSAGSGLRNIDSRLKAIGARLVQKHADNGNHLVIIY